MFQLVNTLKDSYQFFIACPNDYPYFGKYAELIGKENIIEIPHRKFNFNSMLKLKKFIQKNEIALLHSHGKGAGIYSRILGVLTSLPCIHTFHGVHIGEYNNFKKLLYLLFERLLSKITNNIIAVSNSEYKTMLRNRISKRSKICIVNNAVNIPEIVDKRNLDNKIFKVVSISRFDYQKNSELLLSIIEDLSKLNLLGNFEFHLIGDGEARDNLEKMINELGYGKTVKFHGAIINPIDILKKMDCYLTTSRWEGMPLAVLEAMSVGLPIVGTNVVGHTEIIENNKTGFLYSIDEPKKAVESLIKLKDDNALRFEMSAAARENIICNFSINKMAQETAAIYDENIN